MLAQTGEKHISEATQVVYGVTFRQFRQRFPEFLPLDSLDISRFLDFFKARNTRRLKFQHLHCLYRWLHDYDPNIPDVMVKMREPALEETPISPLTLEECRALLSVPMENQERCMIALILATGVRIGEAVSLKREHIEENYIRVKGKTGWKEFPLGYPEIRDQLRGLVKSGPVFRDKDGECIKRDVACHRIRTLLLKIGCNKGPHILRHTWATLAHEHGVDTFTLQRLLGHKTSTMTQRYAKIGEAKKLAAQDLPTPWSLLKEKAPALPVGRGE